MVYYSLDSENPTTTKRIQVFVFILRIPGGVGKEHLRNCPGHQRYAYQKNQKTKNHVSQR
jgi:hypothetical protein